MNLLPATQDLLLFDLLAVAAILVLVTATARRYHDEMRARPTPVLAARAGTTTVAPPRRRVPLRGLVLTIFCYQVLSTTLGQLLDYIVWERARVEGWVDDYRQRLQAAQLIDAAVDRAQFLRWFDLTGLQRHLKVLGIFCRLCYRDGKQGYLDDLPRVYDYVIEVASGYPEPAELVALLRRCVGTRDLRLPVTA